MRRFPVTAQREKKGGKYSIESMGHFYDGLEALVSLKLLYEIPRPYSDTSHSEILLCKSDQSFAETST
jgi:hypothetical protein